MDFTIYNGAVKKFYKSLEEIIQKYTCCKRRFIVFGSNNICGMIVDFLERTPCKVEYIIDNDKKREGTNIFGKRIYSPETVNIDYSDSYLFLIASGFQDEMIGQLEGYGYKYGEHIIKVIDLPCLMNDYSHANIKGLKKMNSYDIRKCQIGILRKLKEISEEYQLRYYLSSGTLLGAVRHKGYIPWDDDVDVFMPIEDMLKAINILKEDKQFRIISQFETGCYFGFGVAYMVDLNTVSYMNKFPIQLSTGQSIDLFPLFGMPQEKEQIKKYITDVKNLEIQCMNAMWSEENYRNQLRIFNDYLLKYSYDQCNVVGNVLMPWFLHDIFEKSTFGSGVELEFEGERLMAPEKWEQYLTSFYGNYMELPPKEKRVGQHFYCSYFKKD